jgi:hypothetical protein
VPRDPCFGIFQGHISILSNPLLKGAVSQGFSNIDVSMMDHHACGMWLDLNLKSRFFFEKTAIIIPRSEELERKSHKKTMF